MDNLRRGITVNISAIGRMLDMARAQQVLDECRECDDDRLDNELEALTRRAKPDFVGNDDSQRPIQY